MSSTSSSPQTHNQENTEKFRVKWSQGNPILKQSATMLAISKIPIGSLDKVWLQKLRAKRNHPNYCHHSNCDINMIINIIERHTPSTAFFGTLIRIENNRWSHEANQIRLPIFPTARALPIFEPWNQKDSTRSPHFPTINRRNENHSFKEIIQPSSQRSSYQPFVKGNLVRLEAKFCSYGVPLFFPCCKFTTREAI